MPAGLRAVQRRHRRGGNWTPANLNTSALWLDANQIVGLNDGDAIASWNDQSGFGRNFIQNTADRKPTYQTGECNGLPVVRFNPTTGNLSSLECSGSPFSGLTAATGFVVLRDNKAPPNNHAWAFGSSGAATFWPFSTSIYDDFGSTTRYNWVHGLTLLNTWHIYEVVATATGWVAYVDGTLTHQVGSNTVGWGSILHLGDWSGNTSNLDVAEYVVSSMGLDTTTRWIVRHYLANKYAISVV